MRVAIYHPWVYLKSGLERTLLELARRSRHDWTIYTSHYDPDGTFPELSALPVVECGRVSVRRAYAPVLSAAARIATLRLDPAKFDALVVSCDGLGDLLTLRNRTRPVMALCFTPLRAVYDAEYRARHLARMGWKRPLALGFEAGWRALDAACWRRYDAAVAISETVRQRIAEGGLMAAERIGILYPGIDGARIGAVEGHDDYFLVAGRIMWTKNIELAIEAFARARPSLPPGWRLVIAGMVDAKSRDYAATLRMRAEAVGGIEFVEGPDDATMRRLQEHCAALLFTPFNEDWGITPLEAMACGKPVIAVDRGGPRESVLDGVTGVLAPDRPEAFAEAMLALAADPGMQRRMGLAAAERARQFTWDRFVGGMDAALERMVAERGR